MKLCLLQSLVIDSLSLQYCADVNLILIGEINMDVIRMQVGFCCSLTIFNQLDVLERTTKKRTAFACDGTTLVRKNF